MKKKFNIAKFLNRFFGTNKLSGLFVGIITILLVIPFSFSDIYNLFELKLFDLRMKSKPSISQWNKLYFVNIDDTSINSLGQFPWTRDLYAAGLDTMKDMGMSLISFDVMFPDPSPNRINEDVYNELLKKADSKKTIQKNAIIPVLRNIDEIFQTALKNNGTAIISYTFSDDEPTVDLIKRQKSRLFIDGKKRFESIASIPVPQGREREFEPLRDKRVKAIVYPIDRLLQASNNFGFVNRFTDLDGTIRRVRLVQVFDGRVYFNLALSMIIEACNVKKENIEVNPGRNIILKKAFNEIKQAHENIIIPIDSSGMIIVNWAGEGPMEKSFKSIPFFALLEYPKFVNAVYEFFDSAGGSEGIHKRAQLVSEIDNLEASYSRAANDNERGKIWKELQNKKDELDNEKLSYLKVLVDRKGKMLAEGDAKNIDTVTEDIKTVELVLNVEKTRDKIGIIGLTATGTSDIASIPLHNEYPGVGTYHNTVNTIMQREYIRNAGKSVNFILIAVIAILTGFVMQKLSSIRSLLVSIFGFILMNVSIFFVFVLSNICVEQLGLNLAFVIPSVVIVSIKLVTEESQKKFIKDAFSRYIAPDVIAEIMENPESLQLGGESRELTIFFSDIAGFTSISEKLSPVELVRLLNEYLSEMTNIIISHGGTVDKYMGDAIMAFYGAPQAYDDHGLRACLAAIDMKRRLRSLQENWRKSGQLEFFARMGINSGKTVVGNMGSALRMDYTVMGDSVNLASRLEGANKIYDTTAMISEHTYNYAKDHIEARKLDSIKVVGKTEAVVIYELLGRKGTLPQNVYDMIEQYNKGLEMFAEHQWDKAHKCFKDAMKVLPDDGPSKLYIDRCNKYMKNPPSKSWNGVYTLDTK
ncbi:MAG: adenylate/guanylate cyclase domain-containing protein [Spirochaetes bacterium]|nr:adenylate/guanylate cyclase domain-containing protein [Spirochaetota bacterium]